MYERRYRKVSLQQEPYLKEDVAKAAREIIEYLNAGEGGGLQRWYYYVKAFRQGVVRNGMNLIEAGRWTVLCEPEGYKVFERIQKKYGEKAFALAIGRTRENAQYQSAMSLVIRS